MKNDIQFMCQFSLLLTPLQTVNFPTIFVLHSFYGKFQYQWYAHDSSIDIYFSHFEQCTTPCLFLDILAPWTFQFTVILLP